MRPSSGRRPVAVILGGAVIALGTLYAGGTAAFAALPLSGSASGLTVSAPVTVGPTPQVTLPPSGATQSASLATASAPGLVATGLMTVLTTGAPATGSVTSATEVDGVNALGGLLTTDAIQASCSVGPAGPTTQANVLNLSVGGPPVNLTSNATVVIPIPGGGTATYDEASTSNSGGVEAATVTALHIRAGALDISVGKANCGASAIPIVTSLVPNQGPAAGGTTVTLTGSGFTGATAVSFGGTPGTGLVVNSDGSITIVSPAHSPGSVDVTVTTPGGVSPLSSHDVFTYPGPPFPFSVVTGVAPNNGPITGGTPVTITGNFFPSPGTTVSFGGTPATVVSVTPASIVVTSPPHPAGVVDVAVTITIPFSGTSAAAAGDAFSYTTGAATAPAVTAVVPGGGPVSGGTPVTITGSGFTGTTAVTFGGTAASGVVVNGDGSLSAIAPAGAPGTVFVIVTGPGGTSQPTLSSTYTYMPAGGASGYWEVAYDGGIFTFGDARYYGSTGSSHLNAPVVGMAAMPSGRGYWLVGSDGGIFTFGDAQYYGSMGGTRLNKPIVGIASTPGGRGYWMVASDGGIFSFGDAQYYGSMGGTRLNQPIVAIAPTTGGGGYWMVASDGGIFTFGDAHYYGSMGGTRLNRPMVGVAATHDGRGYWMAASDGGLFTFGDAPYYGSMGATRLNQPMVGIAPTPDGGGYWMDASDGGIFTFGDAPYYGSMGGTRLNKPMNGMAATIG